MNESKEPSVVKPPGVLPGLYGTDCYRTGWARIKKGQTRQATANSPVTFFPQEFRSNERDRMGTSGCLCLNHTERLPSRSPGSPGILPHWV